MSAKQFGKYGRLFWQRQHPIEPDAAFGEAFLEIAGKSKEEKFNDTFWERYKMYQEAEQPYDSTHSGEAGPIALGRKNFLFCGSHATA